MDVFRIKPPPPPAFLRRGFGPGGWTPFHSPMVVSPACHTDRRSPRRRDLQDKINGLSRRSHPLDRPRGNKTRPEFFRSPPWHPHLLWPEREMVARTPPSHREEGWWPIPKREGATLLISCLRRKLIGFSGASPGDPFIRRISASPRMTKSNRSEQHLVDPKDADPTPFRPPRPKGDRKATHCCR